MIWDHFGGGVTSELLLLQFWNGASDVQGYIEAVDRGVSMMYKGM